MSWFLLESITPIAIPTKMGTTMSDSEKLQVLIEALRHIMESDPGPASYIAKAALKEIDELVKEALQ